MFSEIKLKGRDKFTQSKILDVSLQSQSMYNIDNFNNHELLKFLLDLFPIV